MTRLDRSIVIKSTETGKDVNSVGMDRGPAAQNPARQSSLYIYDIGVWIGRLKIKTSYFENFHYHATKTKTRS